MYAFVYISKNYKAMKMKHPKDSRFQKVKEDIHLGGGGGYRNTNHKRSYLSSSKKEEIVKINYYEGDVLMKTNQLK